jgi:hypothetical protein
MGLFKKKDGMTTSGGGLPMPSGDEYDQTFQQDRYKTNDHAGLVDATDAYANLLKMTISFQHLPTSKSVYFKAFITAFNEAYSSDWAQETVYGRADPIYMFKNTTRRISLAFKVPAASSGEAYENLGKVQQLIQFLYPNYDDVQYGQTITQSPLIRMKVMNILRDSSDQIKGPLSGAQRSLSGNKLAYQKYNEYVSVNDSSLGLLGVISSVAVNHNLENTDVGVIEKAQNTILPKMIEINLEFAAIHEHPLGWNEDGTFGSKGYEVRGSGVGTAFPYGVDLYDPAQVQAAIADDAAAIASMTDRTEELATEAQLEALDFAPQAAAIIVEDAVNSASLAEDAAKANAVLGQLGVSSMQQPSTEIASPGAEYYGSLEWGRVYGHAEPTLTRSETDEGESFAEDDPLAGFL